MIRADDEDAVDLLVLDAIDRAELRTEPYEWAHLEGVVDPSGALAREYPTDRYREVVGRDDEKSWAYWSRSLVPMGAPPPDDDSTSPAWRALARAVHGRACRAALTRLTGVDVTSALLEVNALVYPSDGDLGAHTDLTDKLLTLVLYFNAPDEPVDGDLLILRSRDERDVAARIPPVAGHAAVLVRSDRSWHAVEPVRPGGHPRKAVTVTYYRPGSTSTMWPPGATFELVDRPG